MGAAQTSASAADRRAWAHLVVEAAGQAERPRRDPRELARAAKACLTCVVPAGPWDRTNPLFQLLDLARHVAGLGPAGRVAHAAVLGARMAEAKALWPEAEAEAPPPPPKRALGGACSTPTPPVVRYPSPRRYPAPGTPRYRADIDG